MIITIKTNWNCLLHATKKVRSQCDQIGRNLPLCPTFKSLWLFWGGLTFLPKCSTYIRTIFILLLSKFLLLNLPNKEDIIYPSGHTVRTATERENRQTEKQYTRNQTKPLIWQFNLSSCNQLGEFPAAASAAAAFSYFFKLHLRFSMLERFHSFT